jgi:hypothetical protein
MDQKIRPAVGMIAEVGRYDEYGQWTSANPAKYRIVAVSYNGRLFWTDSGQQWFANSPSVRYYWPREAINE